MPVHDILENKKRYAYLVICERRKFIICARDSIVVLTHTAWATIVTSAQMVSYDLQITTWHSWLTFLFIINCLWVYGIKN